MPERPQEAIHMCVTSEDGNSQRQPHQIVAMDVADAPSGEVPVGRRRGGASDILWRAIARTIEQMEDQCACE
jgi:hypothetical protein